MSKKRLLVVFACLIFVSLPVIAFAENIYVKDQTGKMVQPALPAKTVVLTFDDGPSKYTPEILDILKQKNVKATFFILGNQVFIWVFSDLVDAELICLNDYSTECRPNLYDRKKASV